jgi:hypothetical protein
MESFTSPLVLFSAIFGGIGSMLSSMGQVLTWMLVNLWWIAPPALFLIFMRAWFLYIRAQFIASQDVLLLEIRLPAEVMKTPDAMQAVLEGMWTKSGESTFINRLWEGKVRAWYSLEMVSVGGQTRFYVWTWAKNRRLVERSFYAHYPDVEIIEADDYALLTPFSFETHEMTGFDYALKDDAGVPIKTYREYHLDQTATKEEQKTDPIAHIIEFMGSMQQGEHLWLQLIIRADVKEDVTWGFFRNKNDLKTKAKEKIKAIRKDPESEIFFPDGKSGKVLSDEQLKQIAAINKTLLTSAHWDVGIRCMYIAEKSAFDGTTIGGMASMWQPFTAPGYNSFKPAGHGPEAFDYPWQDFQDIRKTRRKIKLFEAYQDRGWYHPPYEYEPIMLTSEELATIYHIPGTVAKTPTLHRIQSSTAISPANLPT